MIIPIDLSCLSGLGQDGVRKISGNVVDTVRNFSARRPATGATRSWRGWRERGCARGGCLARPALSGSVTKCGRGARLPQWPPLGNLVEGPVFVTKAVLRWAVFVSSPGRAGVRFQIGLQILSDYLRLVNDQGTRHLN